jgi:uncharacterized membrane protein
MSCPACGEPVADDDAICSHCGAKLRAGSTTDTTGERSTEGGGNPEKTVLGLERNIAGAFSYSLTFVSGLVFYLLSDDEFVRFHAAQSTIVFGVLFTLNLVVSFLQGVVALVPEAGPTLTVVFGALSGGLSLLAFGLWILLMIKAYQGERFQVPFVESVLDGFA